MKKLIYFAVFLLGFDFCSASNLPKQLATTFVKHSLPNQSTKFVTQEEKAVLCAALKISYLNETGYDHPLSACEYSRFDVIKSSLYQTNSREYDVMTNLHKNEIESKKIASMSIEWIDNSVGYGAFAQEDIARRKFIGVYGGLVRGISQTGTLYSWGFPPTKETPDCYVDGTVFGNELRFVNDGGGKSNCRAISIIGADKRFHLCYTALKDIQKGEQLLIDYGQYYWCSPHRVYQDLTAKK